MRGVTEHCLAGIQSHCPYKVDDIQAVRKSSTDQCNSSGQLLFSVDQGKSFFHAKKLRRLPSAFSRIGISSGTAALVKCHFLINWFYECAIFIQYFSVTSWVTPLAWQTLIVQTVLYPTAEAILHRLNYMCLFSGRKLGTFFMIHPVFLQYFNRCHF